MDAWVLVTGGAKRLGREICLAFARAGWHVLCHYQHSHAQAHSVCDEVRALGVQALTVQGDLAQPDGAEQVFAQAAQHAGARLLCIVNNASLFEPDSGRDFSNTQALLQMQVNVLAPMHMGRLLATLHTHSEPGAASLVHVLDQKVFNLNPDYFSYTLSKLSLERAVSLQAQSLAPTLRVNAVAPGLMYPSGPQSAANFALAAQVNLMRRPIPAQEVARSVVFLASTASITGSTLRVDNGQHLVPLGRDVMFAVEQGTPLP